MSDGKADLVLRVRKESDLFECLASVGRPPELNQIFIVHQNPIEGDDLDGDVVVQTRKPIGEAEAANRGFALALQHDDPPYVLLLDDDVRIPEGDQTWINRMIEELEEAGPQCAAVGACSNSSNVPQHILFAPKSYLVDWKSEDGKRGGPARNPSSPWLHTFAALFRKPVIAQCGLWDLQFTVGGYDGVDYSILLRSKQYTLRVALSVYVHRAEQPEPIIFSETHDRWVKKWGIGRLYDMKVIAPEQLRAMLRGQ